MVEIPVKHSSLYNKFIYQSFRRSAAKISILCKFKGYRKIRIFKLLCSFCQAQQQLVNFYVQADINKGGGGKD